MVIAATFLYGYDCKPASSADTKVWPGNPHNRYFLSEEAVLRILTEQDSVIRDESAGIHNAVRLEAIKPVTAAAYHWD